MTAQERQQFKKLEALSKSAVTFSSSLNLDLTLARIAEEARRILEFEGSIVLLLNETRESLSVGAVFLAGRDSDANVNAIGHPVLGQGGLAEVVELKEPIYVQNNQVPMLLQPLLAWQGTISHSTMLVPLVVDDMFLGILLLTGRAGQSSLGEFECRLAALLASQAAAAIRNAQSVRSMNIQLFETVARGKREWEQTFDSISDAIFISNTEHVLIRANKAFVSMFGEHPRDIIGKRCYEVVWNAHQPCGQCPNAIMRLEGGRAPGTVSLECVLQGRPSVLTAYPMRDANGGLSAIAHVVKDVTEQNKMQELIIRAEKLRAVGEMASGIAHDFNNSLASIIGWNEMMLLSDLPPQLKECASAIHQAAVDGTETVKRIQEYTRIRKDTEFASVDINEVVRGATDLARPRWKDSAEKAGISMNISTDFASIGPARGSAPDLREVFLNIILNAIDAIPEGGEIRIRTGQQGDRVFAAIEDSGIGMSEDVQRRVFDPFFTTKDSGGSGLGLSVAYGIISRHGGELTVESALGKGSTFTVFLPMASQVIQEPEPEITYTSRKLRILLIDDDVRVLNAIGAMLRAEGHQVTMCPGGRQGLSEFDQGGYDLVITDLGMPETNGWEVAAKIKAVSPETAVVFLTGWAAEIASERLPELGIDGIIQKPCRLKNLRETIHQVLSHGRTLPDSPSPVEEASRAVGSLAVLVIEDNHWFGEALKERLQIDGHAVTLVASGYQGLLSFEQYDFDLILADLKLPDVSGIEIAAKIKQLRQSPFVALMTGDVVALDGSILEEHCVDAVLRKPWKEAEMQRVIDAALERRREAS